MHLQEVHCTVLCMEMLRNTFGLVFSMNWFFFCLLVTSGGGLLQLTGSVPLFLELHIEENGSQTPAGTHPRLTLVPRKQWAAWRAAAKFKPCLELSALPRWALTRLGFMPPASRPSASNQAGQPEGQHSGPFGASAFHPGEETRAEAQVTEQRGKVNWLLPLLPFGLIYARLGGGKAAEEVSTFSGASLVSRWQGSCLGWMWAWLISHCRGFHLEPPTVVQVCVLGGHPRCRVCCWCPGESGWRKQPGEEVGLQQMGRTMLLLDRVAPSSRARRRKDRLG